MIATAFYILSVIGIALSKTGDIEFLSDCTF